MLLVRPEMVRAELGVGLLLPEHWSPPLHAAPAGKASGCWLLHTNQPSTH